MTMRVSMQRIIPLPDRRFRNALHSLHSLHIAQIHCTWGVCAMQCNETHRYASPPAMTKRILAFARPLVLRYDSSQPEGGSGMSRFAMRAVCVFGVMAWATVARAQPPVAEIRHGCQVLAVAWSADGARLASAGEDGL